MYTFDNTFSLFFIQYDQSYLVKGNFTEFEDNDFEFAANNRGAILSEWAGRYDGKSDPK